MASQFFSPKGLVSSTVLVISAIWFLLLVKNSIGTYKAESHNHSVENQIRSKLQAQALETQLRSENAYGHAKGASTLICEIRVGVPNNNWDYICLLYWRSQAGVAQSRNEMKFGAMVDSSHVTRLSALVPAHGPDPPLDAQH